MALLMGAAQANDGNELYLDQDGSGNSASINQSGGDNNRIGTSGSPARDTPPASRRCR